MSVSHKENAQELSMHVCVHYPLLARHLLHLPRVFIRITVRYCSRVFDYFAEVRANPNRPPTLSLVLETTIHDRK